MLPVPPLLVISDRHQARQPLEQVVEAVFAGGCRWFSLREKDLPPDERRALLGALVTLGSRWGAVVTVHDDIAAVAAVGADGVHLPSGGDPAAARARLPEALIGASAHSADEAAALLRAGADYVTASPVFVTASKPGYGPALGLDGLARVIAAARGPVVALGGITAESAAACFIAGARGIAVMGEVMRSPDPKATVEHLLRAIPPGQPGSGLEHRRSGGGAGDLAEDRTRDEAGAAGIIEIK
jgi:thiamine-phosphate pyrophosphorylase